jgi:predicted metal-dependent peptidase
MAQDEDLLQEALLKAKIRIMSSGNLFFIGPILANLKFIERPDIPTFATCGRAIYYNRNFFQEIINSKNGKGIDQLVFIIVHEIFHIILDHLGRRGDRHPFVWNMAIDYITNYILINNQIGSPPPDVLYDRKFHDGLSSEEVYDMITNDKDLMKKFSNYQFDVHIDIDETGMDDGEKGGKGPEITFENGQIRIRISRKEYEKIKQDMKEIVSGIHPGNVPEGMKRIFDKILNPPKINWREKLAHFIEDSFRVDYHYKKLHNYSHYALLNHPDPVLLPGMIHENQVNIHVYIDASGSIGEKDLKDFISEISSIVQSSPVRDCQIRVSSFDTEIYGTTTYDTLVSSPEDIVRELQEYQVYGGGGTSIEKIWPHVGEVSLESGNVNTKNLVIIFTDGEIYSYGDPDLAGVPLNILMVIKNKYSDFNRLVSNIPFQDRVDVVQMKEEE